MPKFILITVASSGFGEMTAYPIADAGQIVYASMRGISTHHAAKAEKAKLPPPRDRTKLPFFQPNLYRP